MKYYAFEYKSGRNTTTGTPNPHTGRMSIAGGLAVFSSKHERDTWVNDGATTSDMGGNCRQAVSITGARKLYQGTSVADYREMLEFLDVN